MKFKKQSITVFLLFATLFVALLAVAASIFGWIDSSMPVWAAIGLHVVYVGVYYKKKLKAGKDGIEIEDDDDKPSEPTD